MQQNLGDDCFLAHEGHRRSFHRPRGGSRQQCAVDLGQQIGTELVLQLAFQS